MTTMTTGFGELLARLGDLWLPLFLDASVKGVLLLAAAGLAVLLFQRASAATRHLIWTLGLVALLALPALRLATPEWRVGIPVVADLAVLHAPESSPTGGELEEVFPRESSLPTPLARNGSGGEALQRSPVTSVGEGFQPEGALRRESTTGATGAEMAAPGIEPVSEGNERAGARAPGWPGGLFALWLLGAGALLSRLGVGAVRVAALAREAEPVDDPGLLARVRSLSERLELTRDVRVLKSGRAPVPMTWGVRRPVLLLPRVAEEWQGARLEHVLLHELAHVKRRDHLAQILTEVALALHWLNPLAWLATSRARAEREQACDDRVLVAGCRPSGYARDLLDVARSLQSPGSTALVATPMARKSGLGRRLRGILDPGRSRRGPGGAGAALSGVLALGVALPLAAVSPSATALATPTAEPSGQTPSVEDGLEAPAGNPATEPGSVTRPLPQAREVCAFREGGSHSTSINVNDHRTKAEWSTGDCSVEVEIRGEVEFSADDRSVIRLPRGGLFDLEEEVGRNRRRVRMEPGSGGTPEVEYWVDGDRRPFDQEGREWLASILPELFRQTGINAEARARRILEQEGADGLLREIEEIGSDHVARLYFEHLLVMADLDEGQVREVLRIAGSRLDSDHHRAELLLSAVEERGLGPGLRDAYLDAARGIDSDHHHRRVLERLLQEPDLDAESLEEVILASRDLDSDHHRAEVLLAVVRSGDLADRGRDAFLQALEGMDSDHHHRRVLEGFLDGSTLSPAQVVRVLDMSRGIDSDHHLAEVLISVVAGHHLEGQAAEAFMRAASRIDSDHHLRRTLESALQDPEVAEAHAGMILELAREIDSGHHRAELLVRMAERVRLQGALRDAYLRAAEEIDSRTHQDRALAALARAEAV